MCEAVVQMTNMAGGDVLDSGLSRYLCQSKMELVYLESAPVTDQQRGWLSTLHILFLYLGAGYTTVPSIVAVLVKC